MVNLWDATVPLLWSENYVESLSKLLQHYNIESILDCSGGSGYPVLDLKKMGWDVSYSDGTKEMVSLFEDKKGDLDIPYYFSKWENLTNILPKTYDSVLCRGNSFITLSSYENSKPDFSVIKSKMQLSISEMFRALNENGVLYIDIPNDKHSKPETSYSSPFMDEKGNKGVTIIEYDKLTNTRRSTYQLNDGQIYYIVETYPLENRDLIKMLNKSGFKKIRKSPLNEPDYLNAYLAFK